MWGPSIVGVTGFRSRNHVLHGALFVFAVYGIRSRRKNLNRAALVMLSVAFAVTLCDLLARPTITWLRRNTPQAKSAEPWTQMPLVQRFKPLNHDTGSFRGDLVEMAGLRDWSEQRARTFETDERGFIQMGPLDQVIDLILLADSFGTVMETTPEGNQSLSTIIALEHNLKGHNLSIPATGPWHEYFNLSTEIDRLHTRQKPVVLLATLCRQ